MRVWLSLALLGSACSSENQLDCEDFVDGWVDADGDGFGAGEPETVCKLGDLVDNGRDCDDDDPDAFPGADERCNGRDDDCNGELDNGLDLQSFYTDADGDGFGARFPAQLACDAPGDGWVRNADDCDDSDANVHPEANEVCNGGIDDDCDGLADDWDVSVDPTSKTEYHLDGDLDGYGNPDIWVDLCGPRAGYVDNADDCDDSDASVTQYQFFEDYDLDGYGNPSSYVLSCEGYEGASDNDDDCDDMDPDVNIPKDWYVDVDGDGWGTGASVAFDCFRPAPDTAPNLGDCDESDVLVNDGMPEDCVDGLDQNCNGDIDCADSDCASDANCIGPCVDQALGAPPLGVNGSTSGQGNDLNPATCAYSNASDVIFQFTAPAAGMYTFDTAGSAFDTVLYALDSCGGTEVACNDDAIGLQSRIQVPLPAGATIIVVVDGYATGQGNFTLNVQ